MFEGAINRAPMREASVEGLRALDWSELVARLAAARDLRAVLSRPARGQASFAAHNAAGVAARSGERDVNPHGLACGKWSDDMTAKAAHGTVGGDREQR